MNGPRLLSLLAPKAAQACAVCFGGDDKSVLRAFEWGVLSLIAAVFLVLGGLVVWVLRLEKRAAP